MSDGPSYDEVLEKTKERAKEVFKDKPKDIEEELENETVLGNPGNLITPDDEGE